MNKEQIEKEISKVSDHQVYIAYGIIYAIGFLGVAFSLPQSLIPVVLSVLLGAIPALLIPLVIRKGFNKVLSNTAAIIYTFLSGIFIVLINGGHYSLFEFIYLLPYFYLSNKPIIISKTIKDLRNQLDNCNE